MEKKWFCLVGKKNMGGENKSIEINPPLRSHWGAENSTYNGVFGEPPYNPPEVGEVGEVFREGRHNKEYSPPPHSIIPYFWRKNFRTKQNTKLREPILIKLMSIAKSRVLVFFHYPLSFSASKQTEKSSTHISIWGEWRIRPTSAKPPVRILLLQESKRAILLMYANPPSGAPSRVNAQSNLEG